MNRPTCPQCKRLAIVVDSKTDGVVRTRRYGCPQCGQWSLGVDVGLEAGSHIRLSDRISSNLKNSNCLRSGIR